MCGFAGVVYDDPARPVERALLERMCATVAHRGPDARGFWLGPGVGLGHQRLSIIDLSDAGRQPLSNEDGAVQVAYNGEIYNFQELRAELLARGHVFRSKTDTEVLVHLYEEHGDALVERLDGMFAFALWDAPRRRLLLARDRVGKKPVKYAELPGGLAFASELKALLAPGLVARDPDPVALDAFLSLGYVPSPGTGFAGIRKLPAGHRLVWEGGALRVERYWSLDYRPKARRSPAEWRAAVRAEVRRAVARRLIADVPLGAFLSGGIDSSIVVACMAEASSAPVRTFSIGFEHEAYNELPYAEQVARRYATDHHELFVRADDASLLPELARLYEEPYADPSALPSYHLARETRRHVTVALNGDGGDEAFGGYERYARAARWEGWARWLGRTGLSAAARAAAALAPGDELERRLDAFGQLGSPLSRRYAWLTRLLSDREKVRLCAGELRAVLRPGQARVSEWVDQAPAGSATLDRVCFADARGYLADELMVKMDIASMAHGLEARSPLLDHRLLELTASMPAEVRCPGGELKGLLKDAFRDQLPPDLIERPKHGFALPLDDWFRGPLRELARDLLLGAGAHTRAYLSPSVMRRWLDSHEAGRARRGVRIWGLLMLELWHREVVAAPQ